MAVIGEGITGLCIAYRLKKRGINIPSKEKRKILGCLWNSYLIRNRTPAGLVAQNAFVGGTRQPELTGLNDAQIIQITLERKPSGLG